MKKVFVRPVEVRAMDRIFLFIIEQFPFILPILETIKKAVYEDRAQKKKGDVHNEITIITNNFYQPILVINLNVTFAEKK